MLSIKLPNNFLNEFVFHSKLIYYKYFNPFEINHYNLINKLQLYKSIGLNWYSKYPGASNWGNLNEGLFEKEPEAKKNFYEISEKQEKIKKSLISDINILTKFYLRKSSNPSLKICSEQFQSFYIVNDYHIEQNIDGMIRVIKDDILENNI